MYIIIKGWQVYVETLLDHGVHSILPHTVLTVSSYNFIRRRLPCAWTSIFYMLLPDTKSMFAFRHASVYSLPFYFVSVYFMSLSSMFLLIMSLCPVPLYTLSLCAASPVYSISASSVSTIYSLSLHSPYWSRIHERTIFFLSTSKNSVSVHTLSVWLSLCICTCSFSIPTFCVPELSLSYLFRLLCFFLNFNAFRCDWYLLVLQSLV